MNNEEIANGPLLSSTSTPPSDSNEPRERTGYKGMYTAVRQMWDPQFGRQCRNDNQPDLEQNAPGAEMSCPVGLVFTQLTPGAQIAMKM